MLHTLSSACRLAVALLLVACSGTSDADPPGPAPVAPAVPAMPTPVPAAPPVPAAGGGTAPLLAALDATLGAAHRIRTTMANMPQGPSSFVAEMQPPDRMRMTMQLPNGQMQVVSIGNDVWTNAMNGRFMRMPGVPGAPSAQASATARMRASLTDGRTSYRLIGPEALDGQPMTVWEGTGPMDVGAAPGAPPPPDAPTGTGRVWIGADSRIYRVTARADAPGGIEMDMRYEYDPSIRIDPPVP